MNRHWFVTELYWPEETSTGHFLTGLAEVLAEKTPVGVLTCQPTYSRRGTLSSRRETRNNVLIRRVRSSRLEKNRPLGRAVNYASISLALFWATLRVVRRDDVVLVVTNPPTLPYLAAFACRLRKAPYHVIVHDVFPDLPIALGWFDSSSWIAKVGRLVARWLYRGAAGIAVLGRDMGALVAKTMSLPEDQSKIRVVTNWADLEFISASERATSTLLPELGLAERFVVQFAGNVGPLQDLQTIVDAMQAIRHREDIHLLVVGEGQLRAWLEAEITKRKLRNITVIDPVPRDQAGSIHAACDAGIVSLIKGMTGVSVPSRAYNFMAAARPVIAAVEPDSEIGRMVLENEIGWVTGSGDAATLAKSVVAAADEPEAAVRRGSRARHVAETKYSREVVGRELAQLLSLQADSASG